MLDQQLDFTASQLQMARQLFEVASSSEPGRRDAILDEGCRGDLQFRALVEDLIEADSQPHPILDHPLCLSERWQKVGSDALAPGAQIGPYRVLREIAVGGMGAIYRAELDEASATKRFALKVIRWWSPELSRRFQQEEAILKRLQHPNIAQIVDSDTGNENNPYIVMEYVEGQPIHSYCTEKLLSVHDRILLFRQICSAVRYLHQNLVVHRDLKPGNVLVTTDGTVKLVDFGIAKLLEKHSGNQSPRNSTLGLMTPNYASPEQVRGVATSTLTDVYSLGLLLYELLTGVNPFAVRGLETHEILRRICEEEAERPSVAASRAVVDRKMKGTGQKSSRRTRQRDPEVDA